MHHPATPGEVPPVGVADGVRSWTQPRWHVNRTVVDSHRRPRNKACDDPTGQAGRLVHVDAAGLAYAKPDVSFRSDSREYCRGAALGVVPEPSFSTVVQIENASNALSVDAGGNDVVRGAAVGPARHGPDAGPILWAIGRPSHNQGTARHHFSICSRRISSGERPGRLQERLRATVDWDSRKVG